MKKSCSILALIITRILLINELKHKSIKNSEAQMSEKF